MIARPVSAIKRNKQSAPKIQAKQVRLSLQMLAFEAQRTPSSLTNHSMYNRQKKPGSQTLVISSKRETSSPPFVFWSAIASTLITPRPALLLESPTAPSIMETTGKLHIFRSATLTISL